MCSHESDTIIYNQCIKKLGGGGEWGQTEKLQTSITIKMRNKKTLKLFSLKNSINNTVS